MKPSLYAVFTAVIVLVDTDIDVGEGIPSYIDLFILKPHSRLYSLLFYLILIIYSSWKYLNTYYSFVLRENSLFIVYSQHIQAKAVTCHSYCACAHFWLDSCVLTEVLLYMSIKRRDATNLWSASPRRSTAHYHVLVSCECYCWAALYWHSSYYFYFSSFTLLLSCIINLAWD